MKEKNFTGKIEILLTLRTAYKPDHILGKMLDGSRVHYAKCILKCNIIQILFVYLTIGSRTSGVVVI